MQKLNAAITALVTREAAAFRTNAKDWARENAADAKPGDPASASQMSVSYAVLAADHGVLSLRFSTFQYFPGTVHPSHGIEVFNYSLREARALNLEDLFTPGSAYLKTLADYCIEELQLEDEWRKGAEPKRDNYTRWNLTRDGLLITFDEYQVAPYAAGIPEVAIPYGELSARVRKNGPAAPFANR